MDSPVVGHPLIAACFNRRCCPNDISKPIFARMFSESGNDDAYPLADALGSARLVTDDTGSVVGTSDYDVYGNARVQTGSQSPHGWTGESRDPDTGLTHLRARDYDPLTGQFLSRDAVQPNAPGSQGYNPYAYTANNPTTHTDPTGHNIADLIGDAALLGALTFGLKVMQRVLHNLDDLPPMAKQLVTGLITLGMMILRQLLVIVMLKTVMDAAAAIFDVPIGRSVGLLQFVRMFKPVKKLIDACTKPFAGGSGCKALGKLLPKLPKCAIRGAAEEAVDFGLDAALNVFGLGEGGGGVTTCRG